MRHLSKTPYPTDTPKRQKSLSLPLSSANNVGGRCGEGVKVSKSRFIELLARKDGATVYADAKTGMGVDE